MSNIQTVQEIYAAFGHGDIRTILGHLAEKVIWEYDKTDMTRRILERHMMATVGHNVLDEIVQCPSLRAEGCCGRTDLPVKTISLAGSAACKAFAMCFSVAPDARRASIASSAGSA